MRIFRLANGHLVLEAGWRVTVAFLSFLFFFLDLRKLRGLFSISQLLLIVMFFGFGPIVFTMGFFQMLLPEILLEHGDGSHPFFALLFTLCPQLVNSVRSMQFEFLDRLEFFSFNIGKDECFLGQKLGLIYIAICYFGAVIQNFPKPR